MTDTSEEYQSSHFERVAGRHTRSELAGAARRSRPGSGERARPKFRRHDAGTPTVSVVIPALNEAANLPFVLERVPSWVHEVVVVDGSSTDDTVEVAKAVRPDVVIVRQSGRGKGGAIAAGAEAATGDIIVLLDADGSTDPGDIPRFVAALRTGADFAKGTRFLMGAGSADLTPLRRFGSRLFARVVNVLFGSSYTDVLYGYNAFWRRCLPDLHIDCTGFEIEPLLAIRAIRSNIRVVEVPSYEPSPTKRHHQPPCRPRRLAHHPYDPRGALQSSISAKQNHGRHAGSTRERSDQRSDSAADLGVDRSDRIEFREGRRGTHRADRAKGHNDDERRKVVSGKVKKNASG